MSEAEIPKKCKAGVVVDPGPDFHLEVQDVEVPIPGMYECFVPDHDYTNIHRGPDDLLVRLNCTGLCMSDVHYMLKDLAMGTLHG